MTLKFESSFGNVRKSLEGPEVGAQRVLGPISFFFFFFSQYKIYINSVSSVLQRVLLHLKNGFFFFFLVKPISLLNMLLMIYCHKKGLHRSIT